MPHVMTLEGAFAQSTNLQAAFAQTTDHVVNFPTNGIPLAPAGDPIGPPRVPEPVFGPGGTPVMYRRRFPNRGPVCDYCEPENFIGLGGSMTNFINRQSPVVAGSLIFGGAAVASGLLGLMSIWIYRKVKPAAR